MTRVRLSLGELDHLMVQALETAGTAPAIARSVAMALARAEADGQAGHGLSRVPSYVSQLRAGKIDGHARPAVTQTRPAALRIDAGHGFAFPALDLAVERLPALARETGVAIAAITRSHHAGALSFSVERVAEQGCLALMFANTPSAMTLWGGRRPMLGTNPLAFAAPQPTGPPLVLDLALSAVARARIVAAAARGETIPEGWAVDGDGRPTTDPKAALSGALLPAGGAKGAGLALMVELLTAALTGSAFAFEATSFMDDKGDPPGVGQLLLAIDATAFGTGAMLAERMTTFAGMLAADTASGGHARLPGSRRQGLRTIAVSAGIEVDADLLALVQRLGSRRD